MTMVTVGEAVGRFQRCERLPELMCAFVDAARDLLGSTSSAFALLDRNDPLGRPAVALEIAGVPTDVVDSYEAGGRRTDPLVHHVMEHYGPVHEAQLFTEREWARFEPNREVAKRYGLRHYLCAPLVRDGVVVGHLNFGHSVRQPAFGARELQVAAALSLVISDRMNALELARATSLPSTLTRREAQIASYVVDGLTNEAIAATLRISPNTVKFTLKNVFRKLEVGSRTALAARIARRP